MEVLKLFNNQRVISEVFKQLPALKTPVIDRVFKTKKQHPLAQIGVDYIKDINQTKPIVKRNSPGVPVGSETDTILYIEPHPIKVTEHITAKEANDIKVLGKDYMNFIAGKLDRMRRAIRLTTEALASQALRGQIRYPILTENGTLDTYIIDFTNGGEITPVSYTAPTKWTQASSIGQVIDDMIAIQEKLMERGYGYNIRVWAGKTAFRAVINLAQNVSAKSKVDVRIQERSVEVAGFVFELMNAIIRLPDGTTQKVVNDNEILVFDEDAPFTLYYLAIDDYDAGLKPTPIFVKAYKDQSRGTVVVQAESKPLPVPVLNAIAWATVA